MTITVNGISHHLAEERKEERLIDFLRLQLGLNGTKNGCGIGACGACTVLLDGKPRRACVTPLRIADGKTVLTIEGLEGPDGTLHPVQQAFMDAGAVQCGFCTPGMILTAVALIEKTPEPTDEQIVTAFKTNLCRCTGYVQIFQAVRLASRMMAISGK
jgi:carbon-monoxide dehydrogenase small subunit